MSISCMMGHKPMKDSRTKKIVCQRCGIEIPGKIEEAFIEEEKPSNYEEDDEEEEPVQPKQKELQVDDVLQLAINHYGEAAQAVKAIEEMAELTRELCKALNGDEILEKISEEMADVEIMVQQLRMIYKNGDLVDKIIGQKAAKLYQVLQKMHPSP